MTKSIKLNAANTLSIKKKIDNDITKFSHIIRDENVMSKKAKAAGQGSGLDLKALYNTIQQLRAKRIMLKGMIQYFAKGFLAEKFKQRYGEIFLFKKYGNANIALQTNVIYQWLEKYDNKFAKRTKNSITGKLDDQMFCICIDLNTFAIVKTGVFVNNFKGYSSRTM